LLRDYSVFVLQLKLKFNFIIYKESLN